MALGSTLASHLVSDANLTRILELGITLGLYSGGNGTDDPDNLPERELVRSGWCPRTERWYLFDLSTSKLFNLTITLELLQGTEPSEQPITQKFTTGVPYHPIDANRLFRLLARDQRSARATNGALNNGKRQGDEYHLFDPFYARIHPDALLRYDDILSRWSLPFLFVVQRAQSSFHTLVLSITSFSSPSSPRPDRMLTKCHWRTPQIISTEVRETMQC